ncbi:MaoC/PaaZ C-terminal domain-containing protein [Chloroflexota bacterium]
MSKQLCWEDIEIGNEITPLPKVATTQMLVKWAGASGDFNPLHYEDTFAANQGVGKPIVHGQLKRAWLVQMITDWIGETGTLKRFSCQFRGMDYPRSMKSLSEYHEGETWWCKGKVTDRYVAGDEHCLDCDIWVENGKGEKTTPGKATVVLPSRSSA